MSADRVLLTLGTLLFAALVAALMLRGWRRRQRRQSDLPTPPLVLAELGALVVGAVPGLFVGTTSETDWLDRIAVHGLSALSAGELTVHEAGVLVEREGADDLFLPYDVVLAAAPGDALAGRVVGRDGMLLLTWRLGERRLVSGFRAEDHAAHGRVAAAVTGRLPVREDA